MIDDFIKSQSYNIPVILRYESTILGTGGAIKNVEDFWDEKPFMVINGEVEGEKEKEPEQSEIETKIEESIPEEKDN